jgi:hypothetical protein
MSHHKRAAHYTHTTKMKPQTQALAIPVPHELLHRARALFPSVQGKRNLYIVNIRNNNHYNPNIIRNVFM